MKEPGFREGYDALEPEFALASLLIEARSQAHLTQAQLAKKMGTSPSAIARLESGKARPSLSMLERLAKATGMRLKISLEPVSGATGRRFEASPRKTSGRASPSELAAMRAFLRATGGPVPRERIEAMLDEWRAAARPRR
jgi:transcriptional regulator with XRE-family HTH domain